MKSAHAAVLALSAAVVLAAAKVSYRTENYIITILSPVVVVVVVVFVPIMAILCNCPC